MYDPAALTPGAARCEIPRLGITWRISEPGHPVSMVLCLTNSASGITPTRRVRVLGHRAGRHLRQAAQHLLLDRGAQHVHFPPQPVAKTDRGQDAQCLRVLGRRQPAPSPAPARAPAPRAPAAAPAPCAAGPVRCLSDPPTGPARAEPRHRLDTTPRKRLRTARSTATRGAGGIADRDPLTSPRRDAPAVRRRAGAPPLPPGLRRRPPRDARPDPAPATRRRARRHARSQS